MEMRFDTKIIQLYIYINNNFPDITVSDVVCIFGFVLWLQELCANSLKWRIILLKFWNTDFCRLEALRMDNGSQTSPSSKQVCKRTQYEDPFAHSLLSRPPSGETDTLFPQTL